MKCNAYQGDLTTCHLSNSITDSGIKMLSQISSFKIGGTRKKKKGRYSNGIKTKFHRKKYKTNRNKSNVSRLFNTYKRLKEKCAIR